ncbi:MAG: nucleoside recognition protein [Clostridiales bacterium]|nr:nucleoside recognition protein [Clostridiales bacterium]
MDLAVQTIKTGFIKAIKTTLMLMKVVLPVYALVVLVKYSPVMTFLEGIFQPAMKIFRLPGEAVVPLITGLFTDEYGAIAASSQFGFTGAEITTIAMMGLVCHSLPVEYALSRQIGLPAGKFVLYRVFAAIIVGLIISRLGGVFL